MPLMPDDLLAKKFTTVRFTEGYLEDEVDSFLDDEVLPRIEELLSENERLTRELDEAHQRIAELEGSTAPETGAAAESATATETDETAPGVFTEPSAVSADEPQDRPDDEQAGGSAAAAATGTGSAAGLLALAQETHDRYVREGETERDRLLGEAQGESDRLRSEAQSEHERLLSEGQAEHDRLLGDARSESERLTTEANETSRRTLADLEKKKAALQTEIDDLETFERDYRSRLRNYLEEQLLQLDGGDSSGSAPADPAAKS